MREGLSPSPMRLVSLLLLVVVSAAARFSCAGSFGVAPTRVDLDRGTRTAVVDVTSDDDRRLGFQVKLFEWTQDAEGKDVHAESQDLIWFPQLFSLNPKDKRIIRVGLKQGVGGPGAVERAYRLFIEEMPSPSESAKGAELKVVLRFGLPIFVSPVTVQRKLVAESVKATPGRLTLRVRNEGNVSVRFEAVRAKRGDTVVGEGPGWYVLAGATRDFDVAIAPDKCPVTGSLDVEAVAEGNSVRHALEATPALCPRS